MTGSARYSGTNTLVSSDGSDYPAPLMGILRLWLALAVVAVHSGGLPFYRSLNGLLAVKVFFVISGFYMSLIREKYSGQYLLFLSNRFLRLWPSYFAVLLLTLLAWKLMPTVLPNYQPVAPGWNLPPESYSTKMLLSASNLTLVGQDALMFSALDSSGQLYFTPNFRAEPNPSLGYLFVPQAWSVSLEILFYLLAPFLTRMRVSYLLLITAGSIGVRALCRKAGWIDDPWNYRFFPAELYCFIFGILAHRFYEWQKQRPPTASVDKSITCALILLIALCEYLPFSYKNHLVPLAVAISIPALFRLTAQNKLDRFIGELSYPVYIVHLLVLSCVGAVVGYDTALWLPVATMAVSLVSATGLYLLIDRRVDAWRQSRAQASA